MQYPITVTDDSPNILSGLSLVEQLNNIIPSLASNRSGLSVPKDIVENELWIKTEHEASDISTRCTLMVHGGIDNDIPLFYWDTETGETILLTKEILDKPNGVAILDGERKLLLDYLPPLDFIPLEEKGKPGGVPTLNEDGIVPDEQLPPHEYIPLNEKGKPGGVPTLNADGLVSSAQLPSLSFVPLYQKGIPGGVPTLDENGKIYPAQMPPISIIARVTKNSVDEMLTLTKEEVQPGDFCLIVEDEHITGYYILMEEDPSILTNWLAVQLPANSVFSVNGRSGAVTLSKIDVGLGNVTNDAQIKRSEMGAANGVPTLNSSGQVVQPVLNALGINGHTYLDADGGDLFRVIGMQSTNNGSKITNYYAQEVKNFIGLSNVNNTADINKPISNAMQNALNGKKPNFSVLPITEGGTGTTDVRGIVNTLFPDRAGAPHSYIPTFGANWQNSCYLSIGELANRIKGLLGSINADTVDGMHIAVVQTAPAVQDASTIYFIKG